MDTAQEALFRVMLAHGWATESAGESDSPTGYFGYMINQSEDKMEVLEAFSDTVEAYGTVPDEEFVGNYVVSVNSNGVISIDSYTSALKARKAFAELQAEYWAWEDNARPF
jgi:hypothetical protein